MLGMNTAKATMIACLALSLLIPKKSIADEIYVDAPRGPIEVLESSGLLLQKTKDNAPRMRQSRTERKLKHNKSSHVEMQSADKLEKASKNGLDKNNARLQNGGEAISSTNTDMVIPGENGTHNRENIHIKSRYVASQNLNAHQDYQLQNLWYEHENLAIAEIEDVQYARLNRSQSKLQRATKEEHGGRRFSFYFGGLLGPEFFFGEPSYYPIKKTGFTYGVNFKTFIDEKYGFGASLLGAYHRGKKSVSYDGETANLSNVSYHSLMGTLDLYFNPLPKQDNYIPYLMLFGGARSYKVSGDIDVDGWKYSVDRLTNGSGVYGLGLGFV